MMTKATTRGSSGVGVRRAASAGGVGAQQRSRTGLGAGHSSRCPGLAGLPARRCGVKALAAKKKKQGKGAASFSGPSVRTKVLADVDVGTSESSSEVADGPPSSPDSGSAERKAYKLQPVSVSGASRVSKEQRQRTRKDPKQRKLERQAERRTYRLLAVSSSLLMYGLAAGATWFRFFVTDSTDGGVDLVDFYGTLFCTLGAVVGMEFYARYAHRILWHENEAGWALHASHHRPRTGPFEANDIYAVANAVPALSLCIYGFLHPGLVAAMCWGTGLGITLYGWMYMFVHDGLVHKRFPVGPLAELPSLKRIAVAHTIHHSEKFGGVPYGLFLAEDELRQVEGGVEELDLLVARADAKENERS